jgi:hypothetical protein
MEFSIMGNWLDTLGLKLASSFCIVVYDLAFGSRFFFGSSPEMRTGIKIIRPPSIFQMMALPVVSLVNHKFQMTMAPGPLISISSTLSFYFPFTTKSSFHS